VTRVIHPLLVALPAAWLTERRAAPNDWDPALLKAEGVEVAMHRRLLARVVEVGSEATLLALGKKVVEMRDQPLVFVMLNSASVRDFIDKAQRLTHFFHTDHRIRVHEARDDLAELEHTGPQVAPSRNESLFLLGLHLAVLGELGCDELQCRLPRSDDPRAPLLDGQKVLPPPQGAAQVWRFSWGRFIPKRKPLEGLDELLIRQGNLADYEAPRGIEQSVVRLLETDLARRWAVGDAARTLARSARTLQRELAACNTSFSTLLERARVSAACRLLRDTNRSITEVGYVCGFADPAHFSRRFKACTGVTPSAFQKRPRQR
jgi:AraC-like DNA-binding protein